MQQNPDEFHRQLFLSSEFGTACALPFFQAKIERNGDITCIGTEEGWLYLAVVVDLFSRRIVGWSLRSEMRTEIVTKALEMAWYGRSPEQGQKLMFHSDRGNLDWRYFLSPITRWTETALLDAELRTEFRQSAGTALPDVSAFSGSNPVPQPVWRRKFRSR